MFQLFRSGKIVLFQSDNNRQIRQCRGFETIYMLLCSKYIIFI